VTGSIALVGSGEYLPEMAELERQLIEDGVKRGKSPWFVQIPTAAGREGPERLAYWEELGRTQAQELGIEQKYLPIYGREEAHSAEHVRLIEGGALIYLSGGDPHHLATSLVGTPVGDAIKSSWISGSSLAGCSAGAMAMSESVPHFRFSRSEPTVGMSLTPKLRVIPHFDKFFRWIPESAAQRLLQVPDDSILVGIDELTALVKRSGEEEWSVHGKAKVHLLKGLPQQQLTHGDRIALG